MKKPTYYFINYKGEKTRARNSANEYKYGLVQKWKDGEEHCIKCSIKKEIIEAEFKYMTRGFGHDFKEKVDGKYLWSNQFNNPDDLRIVEVFKD